MQNECESNLFKIQHKHNIKKLVAKHGLKREPYIIALYKKVCRQYEEASNIKKFIPVLVYNEVDKILKSRR